MKKNILYTRQYRKPLLRAKAVFLTVAMFISVLLFAGCRDDSVPDTPDSGDTAPQTSADSSEDSRFERDGVLNFDNYSTIETYDGKNGKFYYRFHEPLREHDEPLPLIIYMHGLEEALQTKSELLLSSAGMFVHALYNLENEDAEYAHYALIPMTPLPEEGWWSGSQLRDFGSLTFEIIENYNIDPCRVYVMGLSMGGYAVCDFVNYMPPNTFAAAVPISGAVDMLDPESLYNTAFRIYHAADDDVVDVFVARSLYGQLTAAGHPKTEYIETEFGGHGGPIKAVFEDEEFFEWLFGQSLPRTAEEQSP